MSRLPGCVAAAAAPQNSPHTHKTHKHYPPQSTKQAPQPQRGVKASAITQPEADDPLADKYGDPPMVQSTEQTGRVWTKVEALTPELEGKTVRGAAAVVGGGGGWLSSSSWVVGWW